MINFIIIEFNIVNIDYIYLYIKLKIIISIVLKNE
jgi:hypothetical protein